MPISQNTDEWKSRWSRRRHKQAWQDETWVQCRVHQVPPLEQVRLCAVVYWPDRRRRDLDNFHAPIFKGVQDGLKMAGVIEDDDTRYIPELPGLSFDYDGADPRTEITVTEVEQP